MKTSAIGFLLIVALSASARGDQWVCPLYESLDLGDGFSEYYCEICVGTFGTYTLPTGTPPGDCSDPAKKNCSEQTKMYSELQNLL